MVKTNLTLYELPETPPDSQATRRAPVTPLAFALMPDDATDNPGSAVTVSETTCSPGASQGDASCVGTGDKSKPKSSDAPGSLTRLGVETGKAIDAPKEKAPYGAQAATLMIRCSAGMGVKRFSADTLKMRRSL